MGELAQKICAIMGVPPRIATEPQRIRPAGGDIDRLLASHAKAARLLGWRPEVPPDEGLKRTIEWIEQHRSFYPDRDQLA